MIKRKYDREFKLNALKLYRESGKTLTTLFKDLGIPSATFCGWIKEFETQGENSFPGSEKIKPCTKDEEIEELRALENSSMALC